MEVKAHAKERPPSAAARWLSCPGSVVTSQLYPNDESDQSLKGDYAHYWLEVSVLFGIVEPVTEDEDLNENLANTLEWVYNTKNHYGPECKVYTEQVYDIQETGEWGTCDLTFVSPQALHIADYKNGYVIVDVFRNAQLMIYLLGAIAKYGERDAYYISVLQPNGSHIDGPFRTYTVTNDDLVWIKQQIAWSLANETVFAAGSHCKKSYCPHRGNCRSFLTYAQENASDAWFPADVNALTDDQLAKALDHADILQGLRDELRKAAMSRIMQMDRRIIGYKVVKGRRDREFLDERLVELALRETFNASDTDMFSKSFASVKGVEDFIKAWSRKHKLGRGGWVKVWENHISPHVRENVGGLTLERATDARPAHKRGSEFGSLVAPNGMDGKVTLL